MSSLIEARAAFLKHCIEETYPGDIHSVTFQPKPTRINQDRLVVEEWSDISSLPWLFLAVLDGTFLLFSLVWLQLTGVAHQVMGGWRHQNIPLITYLVAYMLLCEKQS